MVGEVAQSMTRIYVTMDNHQVDTQESVVEMEGKFHDQIVSILIDPGYNYIYASPDLVDK